MARKKRKRGKITMPQTADVPARRTQGMRKPAEDATRPAMEARMRMMGLPHTDEGKTAAKSPLAGCNAGRAILENIADVETQNALWGAVKHLRAVYARYGHAIGAPDRYAKCLRILLPVESMETSADAPATDDRSEEEKYRAAISAYMATETWLGYTDKPARSECLRHVVDQPDIAVSDWPGMQSALLCVCDGMAGRKIVYRGRDVA